MRLAPLVFGCLFLGCASPPAPKALVEADRAGAGTLDWATADDDLRGCLR